MYRISIEDYTYIGSTRDFKQRKQRHKSNCNNVNNPKHNFKVYQMIRENGGWNCSEMIPIEECECEDKLQAHIREEELRKEYNAEMNTNKVIHNKQEYKKEYYEKNKEKVLQQNKEWCEVNKEKVLQQQKIHNTCECGGCYTQSNKSTHLKSKKHCDYINSLVVETP
jgi:hypothetical protein